MRLDLARRWRAGLPALLLLAGCATAPASMPDGTPDAASSPAAAAAPAGPAVVAILTHPPLIPLLPGDLVVSLRDARTGQPGAEVRIPLEGPPPYTIELPLPADGRPQMLAAVIATASGVHWTLGPVPVPAVEGGHADLGLLRLQPARARPFEAVWRCGETRVAIWPEGEGLLLEARGRTHVLTPRDTPEGPVYSDGEASPASYRHLGRMSEITLPGTRQTACTLAPEGPGAGPGGNRP